MPPVLVPPHSGGECLEPNPGIFQVLPNGIVLLLGITQLLESRFPRFKGLAAADDVIQVVEQRVRIAFAERRDLPLRE